MTMIPQSIDIEAAVRRANESLRSGRLADAEAIYQQVLTIEPDHFVALHGLGVIAMNTGRSGRAVELIRSSIQKNPFDCAAHNNLGIALMQQGRLDEAIQSFGKSLSIKPDYTSALCNLARAHQELGGHGIGLKMMLKARGFVRFSPGKVLILSTVQEGRGKNDPLPKAV
ncbi:MAG: tetratricopeptide repeat protein [Gammaproteobacteria bacterium]|nr:tetratricopeptide repeat protein [Gammaproteobacteria bacterium]